MKSLNRIETSTRIYCFAEICLEKTEYVEVKASITLFWSAQFQYCMKGSDDSHISTYHPVSSGGRQHNQSIFLIFEMSHKEHYANDANLNSGFSGEQPSPMRGPFGSLFLQVYIQSARWCMAIEEISVMTRFPEISCRRVHPLTDQTP